MKEQDLNDLWKNAERGKKTSIQQEKLIAMMHAKMKNFDRQIYIRNWAETIAAIVVIISFSMIALVIAKPLVVLACAMIIVWACFLIVKLRPVKLKETDYSQDTQQYLQGEVEKVETQINLLSSVFWWYVLPFWVSCLIFTIGLNTPLISMLISILSFTIVAGVVYAINRKAVRGKMIPLRDELKQQLEDLKK